MEKLEIKKCKDSPYYFAINYLQIKDKNGKSIPFSTNLCEYDFNIVFNGKFRN